MLVVWPDQSRYASLLAGFLEDLPFGLLGLRYIIKTARYQPVTYLAVVPAGDSRPV